MPCKRYVLSYNHSVNYEKVHAGKKKLFELLSACVSVCKMLYILRGHICVPEVGEFTVSSYLLILTSPYLSKDKVFPITGPVVAQRVGRNIALLFHYRGTRRG